MPFIANISLLVKDYDEALDYFVGKLGFELVEDTLMNESGKRFVRIRPPAAAKSGSGVSGACLLLAQAKNDSEKDAIGSQTGGRVFLFLHTDDFDRDYDRYRAGGVDFTEEPRNEDYGKVVVFRDLYGNLWDLVEPL